MTNMNQKTSNEPMKLVQNFKQSVLSKKTRPFVLATSCVVSHGNSDERNRVEEVEENENEKKKNGVEQFLMAIKTFSQSNLMTGN
ncbi:uncharacterized protein MELLADRAFT_71749 [Melampsora larici-populina 98AG31]|uniref:Uncharacterized protein n=1 Tax=Melampsora larici-populina (strain 98AG31 / pathotype 3-4-7) TaxID=747676 RepID=F4RK57_MELLP|nr:uncharacterized protein MELLADRAFT_71749 [Melampsora larici-populina 98AG31]EGG07039.1 hypothetical protein MELLADRAFT_71749 [Melampsora larici-populina 98AG31]